MATITVMSGDTVRVKGTFRDWAVEGATGALIDPDGNEAEWTLYNNDLLEVETGTTTRLSIGVYYYDWTAPDLEGNYFFEIKGNVSSKPQLNRQKFKVKFKPAA